jgi:hypothetical protein
MPDSSMTRFSVDRVILLPFFPRWQRRAVEGAMPASSKSRSALALDFFAPPAIPAASKAAANVADAFRRLPLPSIGPAWTDAFLPFEHSCQRGIFALASWPSCASIPRHLQQRRQPVSVRVSLGAVAARPPPASTIAERRRPPPAPPRPGPGLRRRGRPERSLRDGSRTEGRGRLAR